MTLCVTFSLVTGIVWASGDSSDDPVTAARGGDAAGGGAAPFQRAPHKPPDKVPASHAPLVHSRPVKVAVPAIYIEAPVTGLGLDKKGRLGAPPLSKPKLVGWYQDGPSPGEAGTSLIVGHRDTETGPAIFLNLNALRRGDTVTVTRADRKTAVFSVDEVETYTKDKFPDDKVYGPTGRPELRLMTCGGRFDKKNGYSANVVVFAHLTSLKKQAA
ncbi:MULTISPECIES: class F sortase [unclassified Streptomyces]|uniref:class F sortase n=1 Tax=Streptomyces TaxID=1883 RepID=UPI0001C1C203|nr:MULTISPECIES: class F sortase [unclassified Streptomyces]AEN13049.1 peptidase C60 sortase A and B [Streptomyces sp. SirexAA-E]MYR67343.1 class F sortase [Streptomyces sp. SID4939]MYS03876.1 class F sortase [Streptomyces sp. SID4940]MYT67499.1 class F sortase [Streptomyces sp. SID8357]MYT87815.1 class F sortase [Streptomyces sp. SID8360]